MHIWGYKGLLGTFGKVLKAFEGLWGPGFFIAESCTDLQIRFNQSIKGPIRDYTPLSESRSGLGGLLEDLGAILAILGVRVSTI